VTKPVLTKKKFYVVNPKAATNQIKNPSFAHPDFEEDWTAYGSGVSIAESTDYQRRGAYSMKVNTATGVASGAYYAGLTIANGSSYTFSCDVKGTDGQAMRIYIADSTGTAKATTTFTATGYWQRVEVTHTAAENASTYRAYVVRDAVASTDPFYVDGAQFEEASKASTFFDGSTPGCRWTGSIRNSSSERSGVTGLGGELVDLSDYCEIVSVSGLGHGDWNQILTKMTSGGDMYQTHIRKSRQFSIVVDFIGDTLGEIEGKRKALLNILRPDLLSNVDPAEQFGINMPSSYRGHEQRILRYQGVDDNGKEATNPIDIICLPLSASLVDTPDLPSHQRAVLNFVIPSGLLQGAYNEGTELDLYADFAAEYIVKRDPDGNWCKWTGSAYTSLITGLNNVVNCMAEAPDGKIYVGGSFTDAGSDAAADYIARWNPITELWEKIVQLNSNALSMVFDANGNLYIGGSFANVGGVANADYIAKISNLSGTPTVSALGTGLNGFCYSIAISPDGYLYAGGDFTLAGGVTNTNHIAKYNPSTNTWSALSTGLNNTVRTLAFAPNGDAYVGGAFTDTAYPYLCKWDGTSFSVVGTNTDINGTIQMIAFDEIGWLYAGGDFTNAGGNANADYIARWNGNQWEPLGTGTNDTVYGVLINYGKVYTVGSFTKAGGLTLTDRVAVWSNGAWQPLDIDLPGTAYVNSILPASDGSLYIGGAFSTAGSSGVNAKTGIVALNLNVASASANTYPFMQIHGPGTLKSITNYRTGKSVGFDGLTLQAGEWASLNFDPLNLSFRSGWAGRGNLMRYIIPGSDYGDFYVSPGANYISLFMDNTTSATGASIVWTPKFWGLDGALLQ